MELAHFLNMPLDYSSIIESLSEIEWKYSNEDHGEYYYDYADQFNELACIAADLYNALESLVRKIDYTWELPPRKRKELGDTYGAYWFNTASALIDETDMMLLLENEGTYDPDDEYTERHRRIRAVKILSKEQITNLFSETFNFLMKYLKLVQAYQMICGLVNELRYLHSFRERGGIPQLPPTAYVE